MNDFQLTAEHRRWARARQRAHGGSIADYLTLIAAQDGKCAFSGVPLIFDRAQGGGYTPGCTGSHPIYAALDHCAPGSRSDGFQVVSYALNDLKGHLPLDCFRELTQTPSWQRLMAAWRRQQLLDVADRQAFRALLRPPNQSPTTTAETPNHALQRTAPRVTVAAISSSDPSPPSQLSP